MQVINTTVPEASAESSTLSLASQFDCDTPQWEKAAEEIFSNGKFDISSPQVREAIKETYECLKKAIDTSLPHGGELVGAALSNNAFIFSGLKTYHSLREVGLSLTDDKGGIKPYSEFQKDVLRINEQYNRNYLRAEYNHAIAASQMAARWKEVEKDGDEYDLQYRTAGDDRVREEHAALDGITLPPSDPFWDRYLPPNGWNCRCTAVQVRKGKYPHTDPATAMDRGDQCTAEPKKQIFRFNPGKTLNLFPPKHPYYKAPQEVKQTVEKMAREELKSQVAIERQYYLHEMEHLLKVEQNMSTKEKNVEIRVGFSKLGNKHLYSDTFGRSSVLRKEDLATLDQLLSNAEYIDDKQLTEPHKYNITHFYYYKVKLHGENIRLNVAKSVRRHKNGWVEVKHFLYSINDIKE